jgi:uncharacterized membrane-anchored protein
MVFGRKHIPHSGYGTPLLFFLIPRHILTSITLYNQAEAKATRLIIILLAAIHLGIAITFKVLFFSYYVVEKIGADISLPGGDAGTGTNPVPRSF